MQDRDQATEPLPTLDDLMTAYARGAEFYKYGRHQTQQELREEARAIIEGAIRSAGGLTDLEHGVKVVYGDGTVRYDTYAPRDEALEHAHALKGTLVERHVTPWTEAAH